MIDWITENISWIFSGIGVFAFTLVISLLRRRKRNSRMYQKGGDNSNNFQSGNDINIK
jgi:hypothetical protein